MHKYLLIGLLVAAAPAPVQASVRINEIAWMGTHKNANAEWIELANDSNSIIDISGWVLEPVGKHSSITFKKGHSHLFPKGTHIASHGYLLLERTRNNNVPNVTADLTYTGSLSNGGETLTLTNAAGAVVDTVKGGKNWCAVGGNNKTKETAQRAATGWITAAPTPRATNADAGKVASCASSKSATTKSGGTYTSKNTNTATSTTTSATTTATTTNTDSSAKSTNSSATTTNNSSSESTQNNSYGPPTSYGPVPVVFLDIGPDRAVVAGADTKFSARVFNKIGKRYVDAVVHWAFGDGSEADSTSVFKSYRAPGTYLVTATAVEGLGSGEDDAIITVHNADARVSAVSTKGITIANDGAARLDLSFWKLRAGTTTYTLPEGTKMLPRARVLFPKEITVLPYTNDSALLYPNGKSATEYGVVKSGVGTIKMSTSQMQPITVTAGSKSIQGKASVVYGVSNNNVVTHENTAVLAPTVTAKTATVGAQYALESTTVQKPQLYAETNTKQSTHRSFFTSPLTISLFGVLVAAGAVLVVL